MYIFIFFFFNDTATTEIYTLSLHDALPIYEPPQHPDMRSRDANARGGMHCVRQVLCQSQNLLVDVDDGLRPLAQARIGDRKSTRLNSSHANISYAVFCLKKKKNITNKNVNK